MKTSPFFSVVILTYNCARLLERSLASVLRQTFQNFEIIVVDNSSIDDTLDVLRAIDDPRLSVIQVQNEGIIAYSRNISIHRAQGEWIAFLDADDVWLPEKLETVYAAILENPDVILLAHNAWLVSNGARRVSRRTAPLGSDIYESLLFRGSRLSPSIITLRKDVAIKTKGFSERRDFATVEDYEYMIRLSREGKFCFIDETLGEWHIHDNNTSKNAMIHAKALVCVVEFHLGLWLKEHPSMKAKVRRRRGQILSIAGHLLLLDRGFSEARRYVMRAICLDPFHWRAWVVLILSILHTPL